MKASWAILFCVAFPNGIALAQRTPRGTVGPNILVSSDPSTANTETTIAVNPKDSKNLVGAAGQGGTLGPNVLHGLPAWQMDFALRRQIFLTEKLKLQFRAEAFNIFNHPNFGTIQTTLSAANFGQAANMLNRQLRGLSQLYQIGGRRSLQLALKLMF